MGENKKSQRGMDSSQQIKFLKKIDFFENFDDNELRQFLSVTKWLKVPAGKQIIRENTMERVFYILVKGTVSVIKTVEGGKKAIELTTLNSGACFGEMSLVMDVKRTAGIITTSESFILMVEQGIINTSNVFLQLKFYKRFGEILASRLITANERLASLEKDQSFDNFKEITLPESEGGDRADHKQEESLAIERPKPVTPSAKKRGYPQLPPLPAKKDRIIKKSLQRRLSALSELPFNQTIVNRLAPLLEGECENTRLFADLIHMDPAICCKVIQVANSSYFRRTNAVTTVPHAMVTVGIKQIQEALTTAFEAAQAPPPFGKFTEIANNYWTHSILVARIASMLKDVIRLNVSTDVYLAGLLHDLGIIGLDSIEPNFYPHLTDPHSILVNDLMEAEKTYVGIDHGQAGAWIGDSFGLPEAYIDVIRLHHSPEAARENSLVTALIHLADLFAVGHGAGIGCPPVPPPSTLSSYAWVIIQDHQRSFMEVNIADFVNTFNQELTRTWGTLMEGLDYLI